MIQKILISAIFVFFYINTAQSAEIISQEGDTLESLAEKTDTKAQDLAQMNKLKVDDALHSGQKLIYVSSDDKAKALKCCEEKLKGLNFGEAGYNKLKNSVVCLKENRLCYDPDPYGNCYGYPRFLEVLEWASQ